MTEHPYRPIHAIHTHETEPEGWDHLSCHEKVATMVAEAYEKWGKKPAQVSMGARAFYQFLRECRVPLVGTVDDGRAIPKIVLEVMLWTPCGLVTVRCNDNADESIYVERDLTFVTPAEARKL